MEYNLVSQVYGETKGKKNIQFPHKVDWQKCYDEGDPGSILSVI